MSWFCAIVGDAAVVTHEGPTTIEDVLAGATENTALAAERGATYRIADYRAADLPSMALEDLHTLARSLPAGRLALVVRPNQFAAVDREFQFMLEEWLGRDLSMAMVHDLDEAHAWGRGVEEGPGGSAD